uniref:Protein LNK3 n=1 Tax=Davidia involucrata TaxID=16924 RepID=A0A5B6YKC3_DAVIN
MEWYFGSDVEDLVVPKDQDPSDKLLSMDSWSQLGITGAECFAFSNKRPVKGKNSTEEGFNFKVNMDVSAHSGLHSSNSSICGGSLEEGYLQQTFPHEYDQLDDQDGIDQMNDIFLSSLFEEEMIGVENLCEFFSYSPDTQYGVMTADSLLADMNLGSQCMSSHLCGIGSSKYLKTHAFSPSKGWEMGDVATLCPNFCDLRHKDILRGKALVAKVSVPSEQNSMNGHVGEETSMEESVLQELESVMSQLTEKTRICFRDALYRLAENSKQHAANQSQNRDLVLEKPPPLTVHDETFRSGKTKATESETNAIDRAIANLMFSKTDSSARDFPTEEASVSFKPEAIATRGPFNYSLDAPHIPYCPHPTSLTGDAEVPTFG